MQHRQKRNLTEIKLAMQADVCILWNVQNKQELIVRKEGQADSTIVLDTRPADLNVAIAEANAHLPTYLD